MSIMVLVDFDIKEGKLDEFLKILEEILPDTRSYNGCLFLKTCVYESQNKICLVEEWEIKKIGEPGLVIEKTSRRVFCVACKHRFNRNDRTVCK